MILYGELTKIEPQDDGSIKVYGAASTGGRDSSGEVVAPDAMRKALPDYMAFGAIREMHQAKAAGAALYAEVDDKGATRICAHVVDPLAVRKVKAGVYKGLSIGGKVLARDAADPSLITAIRLDEISLVDRPCNPEAVIDLWKAQGARPPTNDEVRAEADAMAKAAGRPGRRNDYVAAARAKLSPPVHGDEDAPPSPGAPDPAPSAPHPAAPQSASPSRSPRDSEALAKLDAVKGELAAARAEIDRLAKAAAEAEPLRRRLADQAAEIERLRSAPLPPRTAASRLAKAVGKTEDGEGPLSPDAFADALAALPAAERAHLIMKAALARPIGL